MATNPTNGESRSLLSAQVDDQMARNFTLQSSIPSDIVLIAPQLLEDNSTEIPMDMMSNDLRSIKMMNNK